MAKKRKPSFQDDLDAITACFTGEDGGVSYALLRANLTQLATRTDPASLQLLAIVRQFRMLVDILGAVPKNSLEETR
jgi:hypothetical protein